MDEQFNPQQVPQAEAPQAPQYQAPEQPQYQVPQQPQYQQPQYQQPQYQQPQYPVYQQPAVQERRTNGAGGTGLAFGIVTFIFALISLALGPIAGSVFGLLAVIFAIPGLICSIVGLAKRNASKALAAIGLSFTVVGIALFVANYIDWIEAGILFDRLF